jgi:hypothetical protein
MTLSRRLVLCSSLLVLGLCWLSQSERQFNVYRDVRPIEPPTSGLDDVCLVDLQGYALFDPPYFLVPGERVDIVHTQRDLSGKDVTTTLSNVLIVAMPGGKLSCLTARDPTFVPQPPILTLGVSDAQAKVLAEKGTVTVIVRRNKDDFRGKPGF